MKEVVKNNPESYSTSNVSGRVKIYIKEFYSQKMKFKGKWELEVANKLFESKIIFTNIIDPIEYYWEETKKNHLYFPDFYLKEYDIYIEVKGYERDRDKAKQAAVNNLIVLKENEIKKLRDGVDIKKLLNIE